MHFSTVAKEREEGTLGLVGVVEVGWGGEEEGGHSDRLLTFPLDSKPTLSINLTNSSIFSNRLETSAINNFPSSFNTLLASLIVLIQSVPIKLKQHTTASTI